MSSGSCFFEDIKKDYSRDEPHLAGLRHLADVVGSEGSVAVKLGSALFCAAVAVSDEIQRERGGAASSQI